MSTRKLITLVATGIGLGCSGATGPASAPHHGGHGAHGATPAHHHRFDDPEHWSKQFDDPARAAWQKPDEVVRLMGIEPGMRVADIGAGTGYFLPLLSPAVGAEGAVLALDIEPKLVEFMKARAEREGLANVTAEAVAPDDPKLAPASVDRILIVDTWHHIDGRGAYAAKLQAALRPGGRLVIVDFTADSPHGPPPEHRLSTDEISATLRAAGLEPEVLEESLPYQYVVVGHRR
jgi:predicted methyltransferase